MQTFETEEIEEEWRAFVGTLNKSAEEKIPKTKDRKEQKWMTDHIFEMIEERRKVKETDVSKYKELATAITIRQKCRKGKEAWWNRQ